ncbi:tetratricopeptide repeat protein [uncultured Gimesia sp.]|uniref:tetratricopeptide repeat protein n=1 Tax=uncultured Gimesia sp. TaxID=1678688 RepID=UPI002614558C|nr:tetratricopeptide repeat protein [uncultured Gimesia sp.]
MILIITISFQGCTQLGTQVAKVKSSLPGQKKPENLMASARTSESKKDWVTAREEYEKFLKKNPKSVKACHRLGIVCSHLGDTVAATRYFTQARQLDPHNSELLNDFGYALYQRGQYEAAEKVFMSALQNDSNNTRIINNLALAVGHQGRFKESFALFRNIMSPAEAHANLAYIHTQRGEGDLALQEYDLALTDDPHLERAGLAAAELVEMKNLTLARQEQQKTKEQLATSSDTPQTQPKTEPIKQNTQLVSVEQPVQEAPKQSLNRTIPVVREKLISQTSMKKEVKLPTPQPAVSKPLPKPEEEALEISTFRSLDELSLDEEPAIIRISNEKTQEEPMFRSPQEFSDN